MTPLLASSGGGTLNKVFLILLYLACDHAAVVDRVHAIGGAGSLVLFLGLYAAVAASLFLCAFIRNNALRIGLGAALSLASIFQQSFEWTTAGPLTYEAFLNLYNATSQIGAAVSQHGWVLAKVTAVAMLLFLGIALPPRRALAPWLTVSAPLLAMSGLSAILYVRGGEGTTALPATYSTLAFAGLAGGEWLAEDDSPREQVTIARRSPARSQDVVILVDESIAGNYLDINNPNGVHSGLAEPRPGIRFTNFGYAAAIHKCSANSNVALRYGGTPENYREALSRWPSIWSYAHRAGLRAVYIDGQSTGGHLQNMMTRQERAEIDEFVQLDDVPVVDLDQRIATLLAHYINNGRPDLIYVNKVGAHFPVRDKFPLDRAPYQPTLARGGNALVAWTSDRTGFDGKADEWVRYRNSYRNTVAWNVGTFFDRLLSTADLRNATILYTSDHGQDLHERGNPGNNTHCGADNASQEEGLVPLGIIESSDRRSLDWARNLAANRNSSSDFRLFPTALVLMGYDRGAVRTRYGLPLDEADKPNMAYNVDFFPVLGRKPRYRHIDVSAVITPLNSDYTVVTHR